MSDYIVYKKVECPRCKSIPSMCHICGSLGYTLEQVDLEQAVIEVLIKSLNQNSRLSRLIRQTSVLPKLK